MSSWSEKETRESSTGGRARSSLEHLRKRYGSDVGEARKPPELVCVLLPAMGHVKAKCETWRRSGPAEGEKTSYELIDTQDATEAA